MTQTLEHFPIFTNSIGVGATENAYLKGGGLGNYVQRAANALARLAGLGPLACSGWVGLDAFSPSPATYSGSWTTIGDNDAEDKAPWGEINGVMFPKYATASDRIVRIPFDATFRYPNVVTEVVVVDKSSSGNFSWRMNNTGSWTNVSETWQQDNKLFSLLIPQAFLLGETLDIRGANAAGTAVHVMPVARRVWYQTPSSAVGVVFDHVGASGAALATLVEGLSTSTGQPTGNKDRLAWVDPTKCRLGTDCVAHTPTLGAVFETINDVPLHGDDAVHQTNCVTFSKRLSPIKVGILIPYEANTTGVYPETTQAEFRDAAEAAAATFTPTGTTLNLYDQLAAMGITGYAAMTAVGYLSDGLHLGRLGSLWAGSAAQVYGWLLREFFTAFMSAQTSYPVSGKPTTLQPGGKPSTLQVSAGAPIVLPGGVFG